MAARSTLSRGVSSSCCYLRRKLRHPPADGPVALEALGYTMPMTTGKVQGRTIQIVAEGLHEGMCPQSRMKSFGWRQTGEQSHPPSPGRAKTRPFHKRRRASQECAQRETNGRDCFDRKESRKAEDTREASTAGLFADRTRNSFSFHPPLRVSVRRRSRSAALARSGLSPSRCPMAGWPASS